MDQYLPDCFNPEERRRLVLCDAAGLPQTPAALWLTEVGLPVSPNAWEVIFGRASSKCTEAGIPLQVAPHQLRHSFAVHMLALLIKESFGPELHGV